MGGMTQALLLMDIQNGLLERIGAGPDYLDRVEEVQKRAEEAGVLVVLVRVAFRPGHAEISANNKIFSQIKATGRHVDGDPAADLHERLVRGKGEVVVTKKRVGAFTGSDLDLVLRSHGVTSLALGGIATSGVVLSTARDAADRDFAVTILEDLCLNFDDEVQRVLMEKVFPAQATVIAAADWHPEVPATV